MMSRPIRTRFAPSPTGFLHLGGARTALFNWLFARQYGGSFVLRVEDTDQERNTEEAREAIFTGMSWLGLDWDEGEGKGGEYGPYNQSERDELYLKWFKVLQENGRVYEDDGAWRFRFKREPITVNDLVCGEVTIDYTNEENTPDMVVRRSDGSFVFHFVNVVDDLEMEISHVIRGEDHLMNTPKHLQLFEALGVESPQYAHIPLILNEDGSKMSKRDQGAAMKEYPERGFLSGALFNFIALLGWNSKTDQEIFSVDELVKAFSLENVNRAPARFDWTKALWTNQQHLMALTPDEFLDSAKPYLATNERDTDQLLKAVSSIQEKVSTLSEVEGAVSFYFDPDYPFDPEAVAKVVKNEAVPNLIKALAEEWSVLQNWDDAKSTIGAVAKANGAKPGQLMFPVRIALSGKSGGPDLGEMIAILGQSESVSRLTRFLNALT